MQQRQLRLGDILDDYCPRERRVTNHAIVAMVGTDVKQTRCTTCDAEHEYKHAKIPRHRTKADTPAALYQQVAAAARKRVSQDAAETDAQHESPETREPVAESMSPEEPTEAAAPRSDEAAKDDTPENTEPTPEREEGPVHRPLIRASLPRPEGQPPASRPTPEFTIRQPGGRGGNRFRPRHPRAAQGFHGDRSGGHGGGGNFRGGAGGRRPGGSGGPGSGGRPPQGGTPRPGRGHDQGRNASK